MPTKPTQTHVQALNARLAALEVVLDHVLDQIEQLEGTRATVTDLLDAQHIAHQTYATKADLLDYAKRGGDVHVPMFSTKGRIL